MNGDEVDCRTDPNRSKLSVFSFSEKQMAHIYAYLSNHEWLNPNMSRVKIG